MNQTTAKRLYKKKGALFIAFQEAYQRFEPNKSAWDEARFISEIYKGVAIHFKETQTIVLDAESIGVDVKRKVWGNYHNGNRPGIHVVVWSGRKWVEWEWFGSLDALKKRVKDYVAFGKPLSPPRRKK